MVDDQAPGPLAPFRRDFDNARDPFTARTVLGLTDGDKGDVIVSAAFASWLLDKAAVFPAWTPFTPTITAGTGSFTTVSGSGRYFQIGKLVHVSINVAITTNGTAATSVRATLPVSAQGTAQGVGRENGITGNTLSATVIASIGLDKCSIQNYNATYPGANGASIDVSITYEAA